ncbi:MAG: tetraacyldisaccharide 4'-kinase [Candidatus Marinimicrobia bacterium]|nr:tetraacyldisaccharide 4'-kinase [Candidatus Neomarinimicrobiota bacterium]
MQTNHNKEYLVWILFPLALFYWGMIYWRNIFYKFGFFVIKKLPVPVISVGNISVGGTGKTPTVISIANKLQKDGYRPAIISRGYGRKTTGTMIVTDGVTPPPSWDKIGDEPSLMARNTYNIPIVVDEDRFRGGMVLYHKYKPNVFILDDGFQHRALYRDLDIVLINSKDTQSDHKLLPYGLLREPWDQIVRADFIITTKNNQNQVTPYLNRKLKSVKCPVLSSKFLFENQLRSLDGENKDISEFENGRAFLFSGLGDNRGFFKLAKDLGIKIGGTTSFPDHHKYTKTDYTLIESQFNQTESDFIITTEKDIVKLGNGWKELPIFYLPVKMKLPNGLTFNQILD